LQLKKKKILKKENKITELPFSGKFQIDFKNSLGGCPALKNNKCTIHENPIRPKVCYEFPIFVFVDYIKISNKCLAYQKNKLYPFIKKFKELGYEVKD
jgi:Fe-S-cluster containining protein